MATTTVTIPEEISPAIDQVISEFGFNTKEEFVQEAIRDKVIMLKKKLFFSGSDKVAEQLHQEGIAEKDILDDFHKKKHP